MLLCSLAKWYDSAGVSMWVSTAKFWMLFLFLQPPQLEKKKKPKKTLEAEETK